MSVFEPDAVRAQCVNSFSDSGKRKAVDAEWKAGVEKRVRGWKEKRKSQSKHEGQLEFVAEVLEYVDLLTSLTRATAKGGVSLQLSPRFPLLGPHFIPPSFSHAQRRQAVTQVKPDLAYLKPVTVIHPAFYPGELSACPQCGSSDIVWYGWNPTGHREVHGIEREETAIGYQLRCNSCKKSHAGHRGGSSKAEEEEDTSYSFTTTNALFWENREHWDIPIGIPHFLKKSALTRDLFNLVVELRPSGTAAGIAEHIQHDCQFCEYALTGFLQSSTFWSTTSFILHIFVHTQPGHGRQPSKLLRLEVFADPMTSGKHHDAGYDCRSISDELVSDVYSKWVEKTRQSESEELLRTLTAITISLDATFRSAGKATVSDKDKARTKLWTGGLQSVLNEIGQTMAWGWCHSLAHAEIEELLEGIRRRLELLDVASPEIAVADNCCHVRAAIRKVFPDIDVVLDVWHFVQRYAACVLGGMRSPYRAAVIQDITDAILKSTASNGNPAIYRSQEEQERRLSDAYARWAEKGDVWSAAAEKVHADQLAHVQKGCLARPRNDVRSDGSRVEGSHKGWNSLQRTHASGVETMTYLGHDFVLRRNIRIGLKSGSPTAFIVSTHGSHHLHLVNTIAIIWNDRLDVMRKKHRLSADLTPLPILEPAASGETFGLMKLSPATAAHYTFVKDEPVDELLDLTAYDDPASILVDMGIDPALAHLVPPAVASGTSSGGLGSAAVPSRARQAAAVQAAGSSGSTHTNLAPLGPSESFPAPDSPVQLPSDDIIELSSSDGADNDDDLPDINVVLQSTPSRKRAASIINADDQNISTRLDDVANPVHNSSMDDDKPLRKTARLTVPGIAVKDKGKQARVGKASSFFTPRASAASAPTGFSAPLCLPVIKITGLTRWQQLLSVATGLDVRSVQITMAEKDAFFLFMELRRKHQWASFKMNPRAWVVAASVYNMEAEKKNAVEGRSIQRGKTPLQRKTPRALLDKLGEVEINILSRINRNDYKSRSSGGTTFWLQHCHAVPLRITKPGEVSAQDAGAGAVRKVHTCTRCKTIMYPGGEGSGHNHKRGVCSDGVYSKPRTFKRTVNGEVVNAMQEDPPAWPQPVVIFSKGTCFHATAFLAAVEEMYERLVVKQDTDTERAMEYLALTSMLESRLLFASATADFAPRALFKLFDGLELRDCPKEIVVRHEGAQYIHINYLCRQAAGVPLVIEGSDDLVAGGSGSS